MNRSTHVNTPSGPMPLAWSQNRCALENEDIESFYSPNAPLKNISASEIKEIHDKNDAKHTVYQNKFLLGASHSASYPFLLNSIYGWTTPRSPSAHLGVGQNFFFSGSTDTRMPTPTMSSSCIPSDIAIRDCTLFNTVGNRKAPYHGEEASFLNLYNIGSSHTSSTKQLTFSSSVNHPNNNTYFTSSYPMSQYSANCLDRKAYSPLIESHTFSSSPLPKRHYSKSLPTKPRDTPSATEYKIVNVWADNLEAEFPRIRNVVKKFQFIAMDTEFPGVVARPAGNCLDYSYKTVKFNVDLLKVIQLGITFADELGCSPPGPSTWQFNFKFDLSRDMYAQDSIEFLQKNGIDFTTHENNGIDIHQFGELMISSGLVMNEDVRWISFHGCYDFAYLLKLLTCAPLPNLETQFFELLRDFFPALYDIKYLLTNCNDIPLLGSCSLQNVAEFFKVERIGQQHQAGSDSLVTCQTFFRLVKRYFKNLFDEGLFSGIVYGLGGSTNFTAQHPDHARVRTRSEAKPQDEASLSSLSTSLSLASPVSSCSSSTISSTPGSLNGAMRSSSDTREGHHESIKLQNLHINHSKINKSTYQDSHIPPIRPHGTPNSTPEHPFHHPVPNDDTTNQNNYSSKNILFSECRYEPLCYSKSSQPILSDKVSTVPSENRLTPTRTTLSSLTVHSLPQACFVGVSLR